MTLQDCRIAGLQKGILVTLLASTSVAAAQRVTPIAPPRAAEAVRATPPSSALDTKAKPSVPVSMDQYSLGPGDKLRIEVYKDAQLSQSVQVRPDGKITLPLIGDVEASGRTPVELRDELTTALKEYVNNPVVTVIVVEATASTAYIVGEVNHPGAVTLQGNMTVLQALAMAGGLRDFANERNIRILRKVPGGQQTIRFNYKDAVKGSGEPAYLRPGDTVIVPD